MFQISDTHYARTWLLHPDAPEVEPPESVKQRIRKLSSTFERTCFREEGK